jgi:hypothetical protein
VIYHGAIKDFDDFGRDLIVKEKMERSNLCNANVGKNTKKIPEAAIFQLLGSTVSYYIEETGYPPHDLRILFQCIQPYLYSTTAVDPRIRDIAIAIGIKVKDKFIMEDWPMIKCNIAANGERIYHLPMDQQYDRIKTSKSGECYSWNVLEAETKGFRRAKRCVRENA